MNPSARAAGTSPFMGGKELFFPVFRMGKVFPPGTPESIPGAGRRPCPGEENEKEGYGVTMVEKVSETMA